MSTVSKKLRNELGLVGCLILVAVFAGCGPPPVGGDSPLTAQKLIGKRLTDIKRDVSWSFSRSTVTIDNNGKPIPLDVTEMLPGNSPACVRIDANWLFDEKSGILHLSRLKVDSVDTEGAVSVPMWPAGHVRVNLGDRQYNIFPIDNDGKFGSRAPSPSCKG